MRRLCCLVCHSLFLSHSSLSVFLHSFLLFYLFFLFTSSYTISYCGKLIFKHFCPAITFLTFFLFTTTINNFLPPIFFPVHSCLFFFKITSDAMNENVFRCSYLILLCLSSCTLFFFSIYFSCLLHPILSATVVNLFSNTFVQLSPF